MSVNGERSLEEGQIVSWRFPACTHAARSLARASYRINVHIDAEPAELARTHSSYSNFVSKWNRVELRKF